MSEYSETMTELLAEVAALVDRIGDQTSYFELLKEIGDDEKKARRAFKKEPSIERLDAVRKAILARAMLCLIKDNKLGYSHAMNHEVPLLENLVLTKARPKR